MSIATIVHYLTLALCVLIIALGMVIVGSTFRIDKRYAMYGAINFVLGMFTIVLAVGCLFAIADPK